MDDAIAAEERAYWTSEAGKRSGDVEAARRRGDAPHVVAAAQLRLREAEERLAAMQEADLGTAEATGERGRALPRP